MSVIGQGWWLDLLLAGLTGLVLGGLFQTLRERQTRLSVIDAVHRRCWAEQDRWLEEHAKQSEAEIARLREDAARADQAVRELTEDRDQQLQLVERVRREMDGARAGYRQAEQALCQQLLSLERQMGGERTAHRREVQALRVQCDELNEQLAAARAELLAVQAKQAHERQTLQVDAEEHQQVCQVRDALRDEVSKLLDLLDQSDTAQAALQHRANALEQQLAIGQRQLEELRQRLQREPAPPAAGAHADAGGAVRRVRAASLRAAARQPATRQPAAHQGRRSVQPGLAQPLRGLVLVADRGLEAGRAAVGGRAPAALRSPHLPRALGSAGQGAARGAASRAAGVSGAVAPRRT